MQEMRDAQQLYHLERLPTGIAGLDVILNGGVFRGSVYNVIGPPGAGKTILANQMAFHHASQGGNMLYITVLSESHSRMFAYLNQFSFFAPEVLGSQLLYVNAYGAFHSDRLPGLFDFIRQVHRDKQPSILVIDSLPLPPENALFDPTTDSFIHDLQAHSEHHHCTSFVLTPSRHENRYSHAITMADGYIELLHEPRQAGMQRRLVVHKFRGSSYLTGEHPFEITDAGIQVYPHEPPAS